MEKTVWLLNNRPVVIADDAHFSSEYLPDARHGLHVKNALDIVTKRQLAIPATVTVDGLGWPVKAIVEPNHGRRPLWGTYTQHRHLEAQGLSPFVYIDRDQRLPMTKTLTLELTGTLERPVMTNVYAGSEIPLLPWQLSEDNDVIGYRQSLEYWASHSLLFGRSLIKEDKLQDTPPLWYVDQSSRLLLQPR